MKHPAWVIGCEDWRLTQLLDWLPSARFRAGFAVSADEPIAKSLRVQAEQQYGSIKQNAASAAEETDV